MGHADKKVDLFVVLCSKCRSVEREMYVDGESECCAFLTIRPEI